MTDQILVFKDRASIATMTRHIQRNSRTICDNIGADYWNNIRKEIDIFYVYGRPLNPYSQGSELIKGFLIGKFYPDHAHILLVCAKRGTSGVGLMLINRFIEDCKAMGINRVTLDALPQVINYYRNKFGFRLSKTCHEDHSVEQVIAGMSPKPNFTSLPEVHADPEMVQLLNLIIDMGLSANPNCMAARAEGIRNNSIDYLQVCSSDGYLMTLCLDEVVPQRKRKQPTRRQGKRVRVS